MSYPVGLLLGGHVKKIFKALLQLCTLALLCFGLVKGYEFYKENKANRQLAKKATVTKEKPFVVIIPSYNNSLYCEKNLHSVLTQNYKNFRIIYIDDASKDDTLTKVTEFIADSPLKDKVRLVHNQVNQGSLSNLYSAIHSCDDEEIVVTVDGDDFLAHENVLSKLNKIYSLSPTWVTYGNFLDYPSYKQKPVSCKPFPKSVIFNNSFRKHEWVSSHLKTFYAGLFKQIRKEDLCYKGSFMPMGGDLALMMPMLEMSGKHTRFISEIMYLYNRSNPLSDHIINLPLQSECANYVRGLPKYKKLKALPFETMVSAQPVKLDQEPL